MKIMRSIVLPLSGLLVVANLAMVCYLIWG